MCTKSYNGASRRVVSYASGAASFEPMTPWMPISGATKNVVMNMNIRSRQGTLAVSPAVQMAAVRPDEPDLPAAVPATGGYKSTDAYHYLVESAGSGLFDLDNKMFWRFGVFYNGGGSSFGQADVGLDVAVDVTGRMLGRRTVEFQPTNDNTGSGSVSVFPFTKWESVVGASEVKAAFVIASSRNGNLRYGLYVRYANDTNEPGDWVALETEPTLAPSGNSQTQTGAVPLSAGSNALFQLAVGCSDTTTPSSAEARATVHVLAMAIG